jgi:hypothetical protein
MVTLSHGNASARRLEYARLRELYDTAFRRLTDEVRQRHLAAPHAPGPTDEAEADARMRTAISAVRCRRDALAKFLMTVQQPGVPNPHLQNAAYFVWFNAGCPSGTSLSDWRAAEQEFLHA